MVEELKEKSETVARLEAEVAGMKKNEAISQNRIIEEFKSFENYQEEVENAVSKYFSKSFDFCKRQLAHHHPNLGIDLDGMGMDYDMFEKKEAGKDKEGDKEEEEQEKDEENTSPLSSWILVKYL